MKGWWRRRVAMVDAMPIVARDEDQRLRERLRAEQDELRELVRRLDRLHAERKVIRREPT